jgi:hypothetical protein
MAEFTPHLAPLVVLFFLGAVFFIGLSILVLLYGAVRRSLLFTKLGAGAGAVVMAGYALMLGVASLASSERVLPPGGWKYFCEIDCHIAYSIGGLRTSAALGRETRQTSAQGQFVIVRLKVWFDENTISAHRGNGPLTPNPRRVVLVDDSGREFAPSLEGQAALARLEGPAPSLAQPLRPGESFTTDFVFDVPQGTRDLRMLITEDAPETRLLIGHENSPFHKKVYLGLDSAPNIARAFSHLVAGS